MGRNSLANNTQHNPAAIFLYLCTQNIELMDTSTLDYAKRVVDYIAFMVNDFSEKYELSPKESFRYLHRHGGVEFLNEFYDVEHCENPVHTLESLQYICKRKGGML
jgi:hypothetical protein